MWWRIAPDHGTTDPQLHKIQSQSLWYLSHCPGRCIKLTQGHGSNDGRGELLMLSVGAVLTGATIRKGLTSVSGITHDRVRWKAAGLLLLHDEKDLLLSSWVSWEAAPALDSAGWSYQWNDLHMLFLCKTQRLWAHDALLLKEQVTWSSTLLAMPWVTCSDVQVAGS